MLMRLILTVVVIISPSLVARADGVSVGDSLGQGIVVDIDTAKGLVLLAQVEQHLTRYNWNDAQNEITIQNDSTDEDWRLPTLLELEKIYLARERTPKIAKVTYWSSEVDATYDAYQDRQIRTEGTSSADALDGSFADYGSHRDEHVRNVNFHGGLIEWKKKSELCRLMKVRTIPINAKE